MKVIIVGEEFVKVNGILHASKQQLLKFCQSMLHSCMNVADTVIRNNYMACSSTLDNDPIGTNRYIEGIQSTSYITHTIVDAWGTPQVFYQLYETIDYSVMSGDYYGIDYARGDFSWVEL